MTSNTKGALFALLGFAFFSGHDVVIKFLGATYSPTQILFFSVLFTFPLISFMLVGDPSAENLRPRHARWAIIRSLVLVMNAVGAFYAFSTIPLSQAYAILFSMPLFVTLLSIPMLGEKVGAHRFAAVALGLAGVLVVVRPGSAELEWGHLAALASAFGSALGSTIVRKVGRGEREVVLLLYPILASFVIMGVVLPFDYKPMALPDIGATAVLALMAFLAMRCMLAAYKTGEAVVVAPMQYSQIIWATLFGALLFDELPDLTTLVGASLIIASGLYILWREASTNRSAHQPVIRARTRLQAYIPLSVGKWRNGK